MRDENVLFSVLKKNILDFDSFNQMQNYLNLLDPMYSPGKEAIENLWKCGIMCIIIIVITNIIILNNNGNDNMSLFLLLIIIIIIIH